MCDKSAEGMVIRCMALFALSLSWSNMAWNRNFCGSAARDLWIETSALIARLASVSLLWQISFRSRKPCHRSPAKACSRGPRAVAPWLIMFGRKAKTAWISRKALWRESWSSGVVCHMPVNLYFSANVRDDLPPLAFGTQACSAGDVPKVPKGQGLAPPPR